MGNLIQLHSVNRFRNLIRFRNCFQLCNSIQFHNCFRFHNLIQRHCRGCFRSCWRDCCYHSWLRKCWLLEGNRWEGYTQSEQHVVGKSQPFDTCKFHSGSDPGDKQFEGSYNTNLDCSYNLILRKRRNLVHLSN